MSIEYIQQLFLLIFSNICVVFDIIPAALSDSLQKSHHNSKLIMAVGATFCIFPFFNDYDRYSRRYIVNIEV